jgi:hypothetical protein
MANTSKGQLLGIYRNCIAAVHQFLNRANYAVNCAGVKPGHANGTDRIVIELTEPLYFQDWPYRIGSKERIDILAEFAETIRVSDGRCVHSTLWVNYFRRDGDKRIASDAVHYDFSEVVQTQHPICHAQGMNTILQRHPDGFPEDLDVSPIKNRNQSVRIPTAFVNFAGLLAKLTADHLPAETYKEFWTTCKSNVDEIPQHATNEICNQIFGAATLGSYGWYKR